MKHSHAVVWLDHVNAIVIGFERESSETQRIKHSGGESHLHHRRGTVGSGHAAEDPDYYESIVAALRDVTEVLVVGPANAKLELVKHIHKRHHELVDRLMGVETLDHPSEGQLLKFAREYFLAADRLRAGTGIAMQPK